MTGTKAQLRGSWATRGINRRYIGGAFNHYRCHKLHVNKTAYTRISDTIEFFPQYCKMSYRSSAENATIAATELINALKNLAPAAPFANIGDKQMEALTKLVNIFGKLTQPSPTPQKSGGPNLFQNKTLPPINKNTHAPPPRVHAINNPRKKHPFTK